ncbi:MAG: hypothetical protein WC325_00175 [Candidatus Bathyarchaeia archaeon]
MNKTDSSENWYSRGKTEADKGIPRNERAVGVVIFAVNFFVMLYFVAHQVWSTGFFTSAFGTVEMIMLYGYLVAWMITSALDGIFGQRLLSRIFDAFGGVLFMAISLVWLLAVFPFDFAYFANVLPVSIRFVVQLISNDIARVIMVIGTIAFLVASVYSPIAYKFVNIQRFKREQKQ